MTAIRRRLRVTGTVQGVGFRPFVYRNAVELGLSGFVLNDSAGVLVDVEGAAEAVAELTRRLAEQPPPLARVSAVAAEALTPLRRTDGFRIVDSEGGGAPAVPVGIDSATCADCLAEVLDPADRRHRYAFTNCTNCGPRYTIVLGVPYDRPSTTMAGFPMCPACQAEYDDPADRRFHAQPNACPVCGPRLAWRATDGRVAAGSDALDAAVEALRNGQIVAMKGLGGYHLVVDATDAGAVGELRRRKHRDDKPFAVMVTDGDEAESLCRLDVAARRALESPRRPIVLAPRRETTPIAAAVAPGLPELGLMLAYTPLHHLVMAGVGRPLVMTSGNASDEPIAHADEDAAARLGPMVDGILSHDRAIHIRCDDSVARATAGGVRLLRRSRGYAPEPLPLPFATSRSVLAVGAEMKSTISVAAHDWVVPSHHIGDLEQLPTYRSFTQAVGHLCALYGVTPDVVAHDLHPEYLSSKFAAEIDLPSIAVQHHHAHVAACMVEHGRVEPVVAIAFDGLGYGTDGTLWGGELLVADLRSSRRVGHLRQVPMPGGSRAIREPWRMAAVWAAAVLGRDPVAELVPGVDRRAVELVLDLADRPASAMTSSVGRLFDAVAALIGCHPELVSYEAQAAIELEAMARSVSPGDVPTYDGAEVVTRAGMRVLDPAPLLGALIADLHTGTSPAHVAAGFHAALGRSAVDLAVEVADEEGLDTVVLTGGVFQNAVLSAIVEDGLAAAGLHVLCHEAIPANDGGISVGQAAIAAFSANVG